MDRLVIHVDLALQLYGPKQDGKTRANETKYQAESGRGDGQRDVEKEDHQ